MHKNGWNFPMNMHPLDNIPQEHVSLMKNAQQHFTIRFCKDREYECKELKTDNIVMWA